MTTNRLREAASIGAPAFVPPSRSSRRYSTRKSSSERNGARYGDDLMCKGSASFGEKSFHTLG